jgi:hypothetical protein
MFALLPTSSASGAGHLFLTPEDPFVTLDPSVPNASFVQAIVSSGEFVDGVRFEGLPDGIGLKPGNSNSEVEVYVAHEQTTVPFFGTADLQDSTVTKVTLERAGGQMTAGISDMEVVVSDDLGFKRFCSASMATPAEGFDDYVFLTGEEDNAITDTIPNPLYGDDPGLPAGMRQSGYAVAHNTATGETAAINGMGRLNHENTIAVPGYGDIVTITTDDTFSAPSAQLYMYRADNQDDFFADNGALYAFRVTTKNGAAVKERNAFNGANDYLDIQPGDVMKGEFIRVPKAIAKGTRAPAYAPQDMLEDWSNDNNIFQFIRLEDLAYDKNYPHRIWVADPGRSRIVPDPTTGRLMRGPSGTVGFADNGRIFEFELDPADPMKVTSFTVLADGDADPADPTFVPFRAPDNVDTSVNSLMVQEDADDAKIWMLNLASGDWSVVATVNDPDGESSGIVDASEFFGAGTWIFDVQAHGTWVNQVNGDNVGQPGVTLKREAGQLLLMRIPGS